MHGTASASLVDFALLSATGSVSFGNGADVNRLLVPLIAGHVGAATTIIMGSGGVVDGSVFAGAITSPAITLSGSGGSQTHVLGVCNTGEGSVSGIAGCDSGTNTTGAQMGPYTTAVAQFYSLLAAIPTYAATQTLGAITNTITATPASGLNIIDVPYILLGNNKLFTINGPSDAIVVPRTSSIGLGNNTDIVLGVGGLTPDHLIFDMGTSTISVNNSSIVGTYASRSGCALANSFTLSGALLCAGSISVDNSTVLHTNPFSVTLAEVPEPGTGLVIVTGLLVLGGMRRFRASRPPRP